MKNRCATVSEKPYVKRIRVTGFISPNHEEKLTWSFTGVQEGMGEECFFIDEFDKDVSKAYVGTYQAGSR